MTKLGEPVWSDYSSYLNMALYQVDTIIEQTKEQLKDVGFDTFVGTGLSGALVVPIVARAMDKHFAIVRKDNDSSHAGTRVEGRIGSHWIFLDDCVASGRTRKKVKDTVSSLVTGRWELSKDDGPYGRFVSEPIKDKIMFVGSYLYLDRVWSPADGSFLGYAESEDSWF